LKGKHVPNQELAVQRSQAPAKKSGEFLIGNDLRVTRLGFGAMRITGAGVWGEPANRAEAIRVLRRAVELGINFIDTADSYGPGVSEEIIAEALHPYPAGLVIATKGGYARPGPNQWVEDGRPEHLRAACEASLRHRSRIGRCSGILRAGKAGIYCVVSAGGRSCFRLRESYWSYRRAMESYPIPGGSDMAASSISSHAADPRNFQGRTSRRKCVGSGIKD
jgi:hypothetical protein